jgi:hypothetical protein
VCGVVVVRGAVRGGVVVRRCASAVAGQRLSNASASAADAPALSRPDLNMEIRLRSVESFDGTRVALGRGYSQGRS